MASRYRTYENLIESPIDWADLLPAHWRAAHLRWQADIYAGGTPDKKNEDFWTEGTIPWISSGEVNQRLIKVPTTAITQDAYTNSSAKWVPKGALVMALAGQGKTKGMVAQLAIETTCNQSMAAIVPAGNSESRYLFYWLEANYKRIRGLAGDGLRDGLNLEMLGSIDVPNPSTEEQQTIARFLDHETAKIDRLIAKQERLIELLKEKRQAVISHAVTKGLNPDAKMKDSGVEWLGEVPEHWVVADIKHLLNPTKGAIKTGPFGSHLKGDDLMGSDVKVLNQRNVISRNFDIGEAFVNQDKYAELEGFRIFPDDILVTTRGTIGRTAIAPETLGLAILHPCLMRLQVNNSISNTLLALIIQESGYFMEQLKILSNATTIDVIYSENLKNVTVAIPPTIEEQKELLKSLEKNLERLDRLAESSQSAIKLIRERRSALVSAAVTGKIDVRDWQPDNAEDETDTAVA